MYVQVKKKRRVVVMVMFIDNGDVCGWYFYKEGCIYGDGTLKTAERIEKERC